MVQKQNCRMSNAPHEYSIVKSFRGNLDDNELKYGVGEGCMELFTKIEDYSREQEKDM